MFRVNIASPKPLSVVSPQECSQGDTSTTQQHEEEEEEQEAAERSAAGTHSQGYNDIDIETGESSVTQQPGRPQKPAKVLHQGLAFGSSVLLLKPNLFVQKSNKSSSAGKTRFSIAL